MKKQSKSSLRVIVNFKFPKFKLFQDLKITNIFFQNRKNSKKIIMFETQEIFILNNS